MVHTSENKLRVDNFVCQKCKHCCGQGIKYVLKIFNLKSYLQVCYPKQDINSSKKDFLLPNQKLKFIVSKLINLFWNHIISIDNTVKNNFLASLGRRLAFTDFR
jgi:hypothetical protein